MRNYYLKICFLLISALSIGCNAQQESIIAIDILAQSDEIMNLSEIAADVEYIPLETNEECLTGYIYDLKTDSNKIYLYLGAKIFCFDKNGKFLFKLEKEGRGPEEYTSIYDFDISPAFDLLMIHVRSGIAIYQNTGSRFVYLQSIDFDETLSKADFVPGTNNILLSYYSSVGNEPLRNVLIKLTGDTLNVRPNYYKYTPVRYAWFAMTYDNLFYKFNNTIYFKEVLSDTVFSINNDNEIKPYLFLNTNGIHFTPELFANMSLSIEAYSKVIRVLDVFEVTRYIFYKYTYKDIKVYKYGIYDKVSEKKYETNSVTLIKDDILGGVYFEPKFSSEGKIYSWVEAFALKKYVASDEFKDTAVRDPEKKKALETLANSLKETDNPVLIVVTPKE